MLHIERSVEHEVLPPDVRAVRGWYFRAVAVHPIATDEVPACSQSPPTSEPSVAHGAGSSDAMTSLPRDDGTAGVDVKTIPTKGWEAVVPFVLLKS